MASSASVRVDELDLGKEKHKKQYFIFGKMCYSPANDEYLKRPHEYLRWGPRTIRKNSAGTCNLPYKVILTFSVIFLVRKIFAPHSAVDLPHLDTLQSLLFGSQQRNQTQRQP